MAISPSSTPADRWTSALSNHHVARAAWKAVEGREPCSAREQVAIIVEDAENALYAAPAPDLAAVSLKLKTRWAKELFDDDYESSSKRRIIGDLRRIELKAAGVSEFESSGRSPEDAADLADEWRSALSDYDM